ncbi:MAG TPA: hypothetical protein VFX15_02900 [Actinomycetes bacterium]|nr:hypothetical protein [Actinomycetes bacterium]
MINIDLGPLQALAEQFMQSEVEIEHRSAPAQDPGDRTGDNTVSYETSTTTTKGWFVDQGTHTFSGGRMVEVTDRPLLRVPVGTEIAKGDRVTINGGDTWTVVDASSDETWPVMVKVELVRIE